jgi:hypothetical protein
MNRTLLRSSVISLTCLSLLTFARSVRADEIWIAPTYQSDTGGLGVGNGVWPVTAVGAVRLAVAVPNDLENFEFAKIAVIPAAPGGASVLHVYVCSAQNSTLVGASCAGPIDQAFTGVANQLVDVDISAGLAPHVSGPGVRYLALLAYTTPTTATDHVVGMRFGYEAVTVVGPQGPAGPQGPEGPQGIQGPQGPTGAQGIQGEIGPAGATGPQGIQGPQGLTGAQGIKGDIGPTGATGPQGTQGPTGATGGPGPQGVQGPIGPQGPQGPMPAGAALVDAANVFTQTQTINTGNLALATSTSTAGNITKGGSRFLHNFGTNNVFLGLNAGNFTLTGFGNTATGVQALMGLTSGNLNTAIGNLALRNNTTGQRNTGTGYEALAANTVGTFNTAAGVSALSFNTTGFGNTAMGDSALQVNTTGNENVAMGQLALNSNRLADRNAAFGTTALANLASGGYNVAVGYQAGVQLQSGSNNVYLGAQVYGVDGESGVIRIGSLDGYTFIKGIRGRTTGVNDAIPVVIDSNGQLGTISSSRRFKEDINDMSASLGDRLLRLRPVTFRYTQAYTDGSKPIQYGLVAEEVADVFPELAVRNAAGEIETVHYETLNVLLLKQFQEQQVQLRLLQEQVKDLMQSRNTAK